MAYQYTMNLEKKEDDKSPVSITLYRSTHAMLKHHAERRGNKLNVLIRSAINDLIAKLNTEEKEG